MEELIKKLEKVDQYFIDKTYLPAYELRLNIREAIDELKQVKKLNIDDVSKQRELLIAFCDWYKITDFNCEGHSENMCVDEYLKSNK